jgi:hypothetical protein
MNWPLNSDYQDAIQNPSICFQDPELKAGNVVLTPLGLPRVESGQFAVVYEIDGGAQHWAVRCFSHPVSDQQRRYSLLSQHMERLDLPALVDFQYLPQGILVDGKWYPIVKMEWVDGDHLHTFVEENLHDSNSLLRLAAQWRGMVNSLRGSNLAHGDLQHGNALITPQRRIRLVDYDGMYLPSLSGEQSPELGHENYQHPGRSPSDYSVGLDDFSALVVYMSLLALVVEPDLWQEFHTGENLILSAADYRSPEQSTVLQHLKQSPEACVHELATELEDSCLDSPANAPEFEEVVAALPPLSQPPKESRVRTPATSASAPPLSTQASAPSAIRNNPLAPFSKGELRKEETGIVSLTTGRQTDVASPTSTVGRQTDIAQGQTPGRRTDVAPLTPGRQTDVASPTSTVGRQTDIAQGQTPGRRTDVAPLTPGRQTDVASPASTVARQTDTAESQTAEEEDISPKISTAPPIASPKDKSWSRIALVSAVFLIGLAIMVMLVNYTINPKARRQTGDASAIQTQVDASNDKPVQTYGSLKVQQVRPWAYVYIDDRRVATTPIAEPIKVATGRHLIKLENPYTGRAWQEYHDFQEDEIYALPTIELRADAYLKIQQVKPWADIYIDGQKVDTTPIAEPIEVEPGKHLISLENPRTGNKWQHYHDFQKGETYVLPEVDLRRKTDLGL